MFDGHRNDAGGLHVRDSSALVKHSTGVVCCGKVHSGARDGEDRSRALPSLIYWLKEWEEAQGILKHIDINKSSLTFQGFIVRVPASLSADIANLKSLIARARENKARTFEGCRLLCFSYSIRTCLDWFNDAAIRRSSGHDFHESLNQPSRSIV